MKPDWQARGRQYTLELDLEVSSALMLSAGEIAELLLDGLFDLDDEQRLFPGVSKPGAGERLLFGGIRAIGYQRSANPEPVTRSVQYRAPDQPGEEPTEEDMTLSAKLGATVFDLRRTMAEQRMLLAKIDALVDVFRDAVGITAADRVVANGLLGASSAIIKTHNKSVKPVL